MTHIEPLVIVIVGGGPGATVLIERLSANVPDPPGRGMEIHVVDPHPAGGGRVWRRNQSGLLWMNSMAGDVTMFTDDTVRIEGPVRPGPSLCEWSAGNPAVRTLASSDFPSRRLQNAYLSWCFRHVVDTLPSSVTVREHRAQAEDLTEVSGRQLVWLKGRAEPLDADVVVLAQGHLEVDPGGEHHDLAGYARAHGLTYVPPHYAADADLDAIAPGRPVIMRGMGLGFVDDMVLLAEGRWGRFAPRPGGGYSYHPSGREPIMYATARRGVPYHSKITYELQGERPQGPRYFTPDATARLHADRGPLDLYCDLWPLLAKELGWFYYHELFSGHPERVTLPWPDFQERYDGLGWNTPGLAALIEEAVPKSEDRLDLDRLLDPLVGECFDDAARLQEWLRDHITRNVRRHGDPAHSADLGLFNGLLVVFGVLIDAVHHGRLLARSHAQDLGEWIHGVFSYYASGPPPQRLLELEALSRAGILRFLGPDVTVTAEDGVFRAHGPYETVEARALVESRQPAASVARTRDPLLRALYDRGEASEEVLADPDGTRCPLGRLSIDSEHRLVDALGEAHPRRFALGAWAGRGYAIAGFTRPRSNALSFRIADALARTVLLSTTGDQG